MLHIPKAISRLPSGPVISFLLTLTPYSQSSKEVKRPLVIDRRGTGAECREVMVGQGWELGSGSRLGQDGDMTVE
jgi:hypothetical protein